MSQLCDIFVATDRAATQYNQALSDNDFDDIDVFERIEIGNITDIELSVLWAVLANEEWDEHTHLLEENIQSLETEDEENNGLIFKLPAELTYLLKTLDNEELEVISEGWVNLLDETDMDTEIAYDIIEQLKELALATDNEKHIFLWIEA